MTNADSAQNAAPPDELAGSDASAEGQDEARQGNIVERFWAPFDNAVDDFNRDINKGDSDANESDE
jgi:hypothetical protein